jgi:hypothetical protein
MQTVRQATSIGIICKQQLCIQQVLWEVEEVVRDTWQLPIIFEALLLPANRQGAC